jgi:pimeloyl-ACP methyl ester carboxylesterase
MMRANPSHTGRTVSPVWAILTVWMILALAVLALALLGGCGDVRSQGERVQFTSSDGIQLVGHVFGSGSAGIVLAHMYPADQTSWFSTATRLAAKGYLVLTFDFRGYGESSGSKQIDQIDKDLQAAAEEIRSRGASSVALVGASMGGTASLIVAARTQVAAVATLSAPVEFMGLSARQAVAAVSAPKLFLAAEKDVGAAGALELEKLASPPKQMELFPGSDHGTNMLTGSSADAVQAKLFAFLTETLPPH